MATVNDLADAFYRLRSVLADLERDHPRGQLAAHRARDRAVAWLNNLSDTAHLGTYHGPDCRQHRGQPAHNCACCLGEAKGAQPDEQDVTTP